MRGPANFYDGARARGMRFEPGVGGRLVQVNAGAEYAELELHGGVVLLRRGDTAYVAEDPEGHRWTFAQARVDA